MAMGQEMPQGGAPAGGGGAPAQGDPNELIMNVGKGLEAIANAVSKSQVPDDLKQRIAAVAQEYMSIVSELTGGAPAEKSGSAPVEQAPGARPQGPQGVA